MKQRMLCFYRKSFFSVFLIAAVVAGGCGTSGDAGFETVAGYLDAGGSYYRISNHACLYQTGKSFFKSFERALHDSSSGTGPQELMTLVPQMEFLARLAGIAECRWSGASSKRIPGAVDEFYQNKYFYLLPESPKGVLWQLPGSKNRPVLTEIAQMSADTVFAGDFIFDLRSLGKSLSESMWGKERLEPFVRAWLKIGMAEFLDGISGEWGIAAFRSPDNDRRLDFVVTFPDKKQRVFKNLSGLLKNFPDYSLNGEELVWKAPDGNVLSLFGTDERVVFYSSLYAKKKFLASQTTLASQPEFKRLTWQMPADGLGVFYSAGVQPETSCIELPRFLGGGQWDPAGIYRPQLLVFRREKNGILMTVNSSFDAPTQDIVHFAMLPAMLLTAYWDELAPLTNAIPGLQKKSQENSQKVKAISDNGKKALQDCGENVKKLAASLKFYAAQNQGTHPAELDLTGIKKLLKTGKISLKNLVCPGTSDKAVDSMDLLDFNSCSYVYLGSWSKQFSAKLPLLIDRPGNHRECFYVIFNDGTVELLKLENNINIKRIAGYLHTKYNYSEEEFRELIKRASALDALFESH